jgi:hypothetical protein
MGGEGMIRWESTMKIFRNLGRYALFWIPFMMWAPFTMVMAVIGFSQTLSDWEQSGLLNAGYLREWIGLAFVVSVFGFPMIGASLLIRRAYMMGWRERDDADKSKDP